MREFIKAAEAAVADEIGEDFIEFLVVGPTPEDRVVCRALTEPKGGQVAFLMSRNSKHIPPAQRVAALLNFFDATLDDDSQSHISNRLLDMNDDFGIEDIQEILEFLMEEWSGRPTRQSPASTAQRTTTGLSSTPTTPDTTSSDFQSTGSATMSMPGSMSGQQPPVF